MNRLVIVADAGIPVFSIRKTRLFPSKVCAGYFGTKRFDRKKQLDGTTKKIHMVSASGLLETSHQIPNLDYHLLMKARKAKELAEMIRDCVEEHHLRTTFPA